MKNNDKIEKIGEEQAVEISGGKNHEKNEVTEPKKNKSFLEKINEGIRETVDTFDEVQKILDEHNEKHY